MLYNKSAGVWNLAKRAYVKDGGVWIEPSKVWVKNAGVWQLAHMVIKITASAQNINIAALAGNPTSKVMCVVDIAPGVIIGSSSTSAYALTVGNFVAGSMVYLNIAAGAYVVGHGGNGGPGGGGSGSNGLPGGPAIDTTHSLIIKNLGTIGGGGGGGGGEPVWPDHIYNVYGGSGGAGNTPGVGGIGYGGGGSGITGTLTAGGARTGSHCLNGKGGNLGVAGSNSGPCDAQPGGVGGAAGKAINLNGNTITYVTAGSILGVVS